MSNFNFGSGGAAKRTLNIENFRGLDVANSPLDIAWERSPDCLNLIPGKQGFPVGRPCWGRLAEFEGRINGIHVLTVGAGRYRLVHHGTKLSWWQEDGSQTLLYSSMADTRSSASQLKGKMCILDGKAALLVQVTGDAPTVAKLTAGAYVPTTSIGRKAGSNPGGTALEEANMLTDRRKNTFCITADTTEPGYLYLDSQAVSSVYGVKRRMSNGIWESVSYSRSAGNNFVKITDGLTATPVSGMDNYEVEFAAQRVGDEQTKSVTVSDADVTDEDALLIWSFPSGSTMYCQAYYFELGESLPFRKAEIVLKPGVECYEYASGNFKEISEFALAATTTRQSIFLGWSRDDKTLGELEDAAERYARYIDISVVRYGGKWCLWVSAIHGSTGSGYANVSYPDEWEKITVSWREETEVDYPARINGCTICQLYGVGGNADRLFITGNSLMPNYDWMSGFEDLTYWPDTGYTRISGEASRVMGYSWLSDGVLAVHKEACGSEPTIWYRKGSLDADGNAIFSLAQGAVGVGAASSGCFVHFGDDNLLLSGQGMYAISHVANEAVNERFAQSRSWFINPRLTAEPELAEAQAISFRGKCYLAVNGHVYIADSEAPKTYIDKGGSYQYDWWYWEGLPVRVWYAGEGSLMFGTENGLICGEGEGCSDTFTGDTVPIECHWLTPVLDFGTRAYYKKIKNAYAIAEPFNNSCVKLSYILLGIENEVMSRRMSVFDFNNIDFSDFAFETDTMPRNIPTNSKAKKVMFAQFKLYNEPGLSFGFYGLTALYTVGGKYKG